MLDQAMTEEGASTSDATMRPSAYQELNITELLYLYLGKNVVDVGNFDDELTKILESYNSSSPRASGGSGAPPTDTKSASLKSALEAIKQSKDLSITTDGQPQQVKVSIKENLRLYKDYFSIKLSPDGNPNSLDDATIKILDNFTKTKGDSLIQSIDRSSDDNNNRILHVSLKRYLEALLVKAESKKNSDTIEDQKNNIEKIKTILAIFPGGENEVDFICTPGSRERIDEAFLALNELSPEVSAMKFVIDRFASQLAPEVNEDYQIHIASCLGVSLVIDRSKIADPHAISPQGEIELSKILDFGYNLGKMVREEIQSSEGRLISSYQKLLENINEISQEGWEDPDQRKSSLSPELKKQATILKKINIFLEQSKTSGFNIKSVSDLLKNADDVEYITTESLISSEDLKEKYSITIPSEKFKQELSKIEKPEFDYLKHLLDPQNLVKEDSRHRLDVKKIHNLIDLFPTKEAEMLDQEAQDTQKSKILAGLVTLKNILDFDLIENNYVYFLKFDKKFKEKYGKSFEEFFYETSETPQRVVREEFLYAKPLLETIATRISYDEISFTNEDQRLTSLILDLVSNEENQDRIKELFTANPEILDTKSVSGENIAKILYQFSEEVLLTALEIENSEIIKKLLDQITKFEREEGFEMEEDQDIEESHELEDDLEMEEDHESEESFESEDDFETDEHHQSQEGFETLLALITSYNEIKLLKKILEKYQEAQKKEGDEDGKIALSEMIFDQKLLHIACADGHHETVQALIDAGANVNRANLHESPPLTIACEYGHLETAKALIDAGADFNETNRQDWKSSLHFACENGHLEIVKFLIEKGDNLDRVNTSIERPLHFACENGHLEIVKFLIEKGADINVVNLNNNETPLFIACAEGHPKIVKFLIEKGADLNKPANINGSSVTPYQVAHEAGNTEITEMLRNKGADETLRPRTFVRSTNVATRLRGRQRDDEQREYGVCQQM